MQREIARQVGISVASVNKKICTFNVCRGIKPKNWPRATSWLTVNDVSIFWNVIRRRWWTLFGLLMKSCAALHRQPTHKITVCMLHSELRRKTFHPAVCCAPVQHSASHWWYQSACLRLVVRYQCARCWSRYKDQWPVLPQSTIDVRSAARNATVYRVLHVSAGCSSGSQSTRNCGPAQSRDDWLHLSKSVAAQQPRPQSRRL